MLEASPLPKFACSSLEDIDPVTGAFRVTRSKQSQEDLEISGDGSEIKFDVNTRRFPFLLFLDGIVSTLADSFVVLQLTVTA